MKTLSLFIIIYACVLQTTVGQNMRTDSLKALLTAHPQEDTVRAKLPLQYTLTQYHVHPDSGIIYGLAGLVLAKSLHYKTGQMRFNRLLGAWFCKQGSFDNSMLYLLNAIRLAKVLSDSNVLAESYGLVAFNLILSSGDKPDEIAIQYIDSAIIVTRQMKD